MTREHLAGFLDDYQARAEALARPYAEAAELRRRVSIACLIVDDMPCECRTVIGPLGLSELFVECTKHTLDKALRGDE